jgi:Diadenosine tetraphosphate (Ap4A) hydrolase and other HIT family hydrolases
MRDPNNPCLFCNVPSSDYIFENNLAFSTFDPYPVSKHHALIIPKRHVENYFDMSEEEVLSCNKLTNKMRNKIQEIDPTVDGFNIGTNSGKVAGQSIMHCHIHLIPRRKNDVDNPQGGVRGVIPLKQHYQRKK